MDNFTKMTSSALEKYFRALRYTGYMDDVTTSKLIITGFLWKMMYQWFEGMINEEDYRSIMSCYARMQGTACPISFDDYATYQKEQGQGFAAYVDNRAVFANAGREDMIVIAARHEDMHPHRHGPHVPVDPWLHGQLPPMPWHRPHEGCIYERHRHFKIKN